MQENCWASWQLSPHGKVVALYADGFCHSEGSTACTSLANWGGRESRPAGQGSSAPAVPP